MSNYTQTTFFAPKDALLSGNPAKIIYGAQVDPELNAIAVAIATKYDSSSIASGPILFAAGSAALPSIAFTGGTNNNTGIYLFAANALGFSANGVAAGKIDANGRWTIPAPSLTGQACFIVNGMANADTAMFQSSTTASQGFGLRVQAGTNSSDYSFLVRSAANNNTYLQVGGDGEVLINDTNGTALNGTSAGSAGTMWQAGYLDMPHNAVGAYTVALTDRGKLLDASGNITIPANASVAFPIGSTFMVYAGVGGSITISVTTDTLSFIPSGSTGTRTLASHSLATLYKIGATTWFIWGFGIT